MKGILTTILLVAFFINPLSAQEFTGTLQQIRKSGKIKIGYRQAQPPMSFLDKDGTPAGYSIDLCKKIVAEIKNKIDSDIKIEYVPVTAEERFHALVDKKIDILCGATTKTLSRSELVDFTQLTFVTGASFMTLKGKKIRGNFTGKKIGVVKGTTTAIELKKLFAKTQINANIIFLNSMVEGLNALEKEKIDAFAADQVVLIGLALNADNPNNFSILPDLFSYEPLALAVRRNDADFRLIADRVISNLCRSKQILKIYDKWFGKFSIVRPSAFEALVELNAISE
ncbi:MAG: amino acid ABC transporter substrate-binding protein [Deltaproteobacteria bacterium]|nr:amino acid ABC transporter substrate-binding protein [Deltaproteobacteria bacterium]